MTKYFLTQCDNNGIMQCDKCNGSGTRDTRNDPVRYDKIGRIIPPVIKCKKCNGTGKLTWLEMIFGK